MEKHAYLIMAHGNFAVLKALLMMLDDERNDIYLHIDKKVKDFSDAMLDGAVAKATLILTKRLNVSWGGYSQIKAELLLLKEAVKTEHAYYHLLSGVDLPLKSQDEIHAFFAKNYGKEYISIDNKVDCDDELAERVKYYYFLQDQIGRNPGKIPALLWHIQYGSLALQKGLGICRIKDSTPQLYKGANWFSITHAMAIYLLSQEKRIRNLFGCGICADEFFLQTIAMESPFCDRIVGDCLRYTDWKRGKPYTFRNDDYDELMHSCKLFARKFDQDHYSVVNRITSALR